MGEKIVNNITELLLEVIGYLTPVVYMISVITLLSGEEIRSLMPKIIDNELVIIIAIYGFGYLLRSFSIGLGKIPFFDLKKKIGDVLKEKSYFKLAKDDLFQKGLISEAADFSSVRNICLSKYPEINNKVYLFRFRSDLFFDILVINLAIILIYAIDFISDSSLFAVETCSQNVIVIIVLALSIISLHNARYYFFEISYRIPITHHNSKIKEQV